MLDFRLEHPRPDLMRQQWLCLNGEWDFAIDNALCGLENGYAARHTFENKINVPYCPESPLSGVGCTDFMNAVWYHKVFSLPQEYEGMRILLHIGACDYESKVFVNGTEIGTHKGGYTPFSFDITDALQQGDNHLTVYAVDDTRSLKQPTGKQSEKLGSYGCFYTRTTGIWQSVWLEPVPKARIRSFRVDTNITSVTAALSVRLTDAALGQTLTATASFAGKQMAEVTVTVYGEEVHLTLPLAEKHLWDIGQGNLYDLSLTLSGGDAVTSYFGLREIGWDKQGFLINGRRVFGRFVLDQGFYPDGIYTAPSDERLKQDILDAMALGFNGARLHEKIFEPRYLYHADTLGFLVWDEFPNWGLSIATYDSLAAFIPEWLCEVERDYNHPSLIGWCPFNETWDYANGRQNDEVLAHAYLLTKALDPSRPCIDTSGFFHVVTDIYDVHDYEQNGETFASYYANAAQGEIQEMLHAPHLRDRQKFDSTLALFVSEYGGIGWDVGTAGEAWGYGACAEGEQEYIARYQALTEALLDNPGVSMFCYTQLYDVEQEKNGLLTYDRRFKTNPDAIREITSRKAAIER